MTKNNELQRILTEQNVAQENAKQLLDAFGAPFEEAGEILASYETIKVTDENQIELMQEARNKRLALKKTRVEVEHKRRELKADILKTGKAIDSVANFVKDIIEPAEAYLERQEKFAEIKQAERKAQLKVDRIEKLMQYTNDISVYNLDQMTDEQFTSLLSSLKDQHAAKLAEVQRLEDLRLAKEKAEAAERERIYQENVRLKAVAAAKEKAEAEEREKREAAERQAEQEREAEYQRVNTIRVSLLEFAHNVHTVEDTTSKRDELVKFFDNLPQADQNNDVLYGAFNKSKVELVEMQQFLLQREQKQAEAAKAEAEAKAKAEAEAAERQALLAPDKTKLVTFAQSIDQIRATQLPAVKTKQAQDVVNAAELELSKLFNLIMDKAKEL